MASSERNKLSSGQMVYSLLRREADRGFTVPGRSKYLICHCPAEFCECCLAEPCIHFTAQELSHQGKKALTQRFAERMQVSAYPVLFIVVDAWR